MICTKTGGCRSPLTLPQDGSCPDKRCPYYTRISEPIEVEEDLPTAGELRWIGNAARARADAVEWHIAFLNMAAAFEELAGRFDAVKVDYSMLWDYAEATIPESPGPGWYWVKGHWRSRNQAVGEGEVGTESSAALSESQARSDGQPRPFNDGVTLWYCEVCGKPTDSYPCRACGDLPLAAQSFEAMMKECYGVETVDVTPAQPEERSE